MKHNDPTKKESYPLWMRFETVKDSIREAFPATIKMLFHNWFFTALTAITVTLLSISVLLLSTYQLFLPYILISVFGALYAFLTALMSVAIYLDKK